ncbi:MAG: phosphate signaling complex protein PhoU [Firmicutes bacterium]|jgi:phosphate transport system protein|nr:phosphate signaling complex protein PhoU [Bacillota bacterium]MDH7494795.1 phosphate signaling complex protein PhoU [Bacillota bacterium]
MTTPRKRFEAELAGLDSSLLRMGRISEDMLGKALIALAERDVALADETIAMDDQVDALNLEIETTCIRLIATQQPAARDLRVIVAALKICADVERVADYVVDIAKMAKRLADRPLFKPLVDIPRLQGLVSQMLREALEAFVTRDLALIQKMVDADDEVDHLYRSLYDELVEFMKRDPDVVDQAVQLLLISRYLERIADHVTNIAERVFYVETGELKELHT